MQTNPNGQWNNKLEGKENKSKGNLNQELLKLAINQWSSHGVETHEIKGIACTHSHFLYTYSFTKQCTAPKSQ